MYRLPDEHVRALPPEITAVGHGGHDGRSGHQREAGGADPEGKRALLALQRNPAFGKDPDPAAAADYLRAFVEAVEAVCAPVDLNAAHRPQERT